MTTTPPAPPNPPEPPDLRPDQDVPEFPDQPEVSPSGQPVGPQTTSVPEPSDEP